MPSGGYGHYCSFNYTRKGEELASLGSGFIRRRDQEKKGGEEGPEQLFAGLQVTAGAMGPRQEAVQG